MHDHEALARVVEDRDQREAVGAGNRRGVRAAGVEAHARDRRAAEVQQAEAAGRADEALDAGGALRAGGAGRALEAAQALDPLRALRADRAGRAARAFGTGRALGLATGRSTEAGNLPSLPSGSSLPAFGFFEAAIPPTLAAFFANSATRTALPAIPLGVALRTATTQRGRRQHHRQALTIHRRAGIGGGAETRFSRGDGLELGHLDRADQAAGLARLEPAGADLERRGGARGDRGAQRLLVRAAVEPRRDEGGEQDVARADRGDRVDARRDGAVAASAGARSAAAPSSPTRA